VRQKRQHVIILVIVAVLVGLSVYAIYPPGQKTRLGLDLRGGLEVVFQARTTNGQPVTSAQMAQTVSIIDKRVNGLGVSESAVQRQGTNEISVALPGVTNTQQALAIIGKTAQLLFFNDGQTRISGPSSTIADAIKEAIAAVPQSDKKELTALGALGAKAIGQTSGKYVLIESAPGALGSGSPQQYFVYLNKPAMTGAAIQSARQSFDQQNRPNVLIDFTSEGGKQFADITKQLAGQGALGRPNTFAIVLDGVMQSDPQVDPKENPFGIQGGKAEITGNFTLGEAQDLALVLNTGALPVNLVQVEKTQVSATLGKDSLRAGIIAGLAGFAIVLAYMIFYYRFLGVIADLALIIYAILLWGVFDVHFGSYQGVTLTLPGIAGMILTIGTAADANVVIFERIKEEVRRGKTVRTAINSGYARGFRTILDANVLTLLTAIVLFEFATAQPKGFAFTLILGVLVSMFTAVLATRAMLGLLSDFEFFNRAEFMGVRVRDIHPQVEAATAPARRQRRAGAVAAVATSSGDVSLENSRYGGPSASAAPDEVAGQPLGPREPVESGELGEPGAADLLASGASTMATTAGVRPKPAQTAAARQRQKRSRAKSSKRRRK